MKASIITRVYNSEKTIARALESALKQDFPKNQFEVVVVDDGSTDHTREILHVHEKGTNLRIILGEENRGAVFAANRGFLASRGEHVVLLDSDDYFEIGLLTKLIRILDGNPEVDFVYPDYYEEFDGKKFLVSPKNVFETIAIGVMFRKGRLAEEGFYREGISFAEYDLLLRTLGKWKGYHFPEPLFTYHRRRESLTGNAGWVRRSIKQLNNLYPGKLGEIKKIRSYVIIAGSEAPIMLRKAKEEDLMVLFGLRNDPRIREQSFEEGPLEIENHKRWFLQKLRDKNSLILIIEVLNVPIGQIRLDFIEKGAETNIAIYPDHWGKGYAIQAIQGVCKLVKERAPKLITLFAHMKEGNTASLKSFVKAGFIDNGIVEYKGHRCREMVLRLV